MKKEVHNYQRALDQQQNQITAVNAQRDEWKKKFEAHITAAAATNNNKEGIVRMQQTLLDAQQQAALVENQLIDCQRDRLRLQTISETALSDLSQSRKLQHEAIVSQEELQLRVTVTDKELQLTQEICNKLKEDLSQQVAVVARLRMDCEDARADANQEKLRSDSANRRVMEIRQLADKRSEELAAATEQLAKMGFYSSSGSNIEQQLFEDKKKLKFRIDELENDQAM